MWKNLFLIKIEDVKHNERYIEESREMAENEWCVNDLGLLLIYVSFSKNREQNMYILNFMR